MRKLFFLLLTIPLLASCTLFEVRESTVSTPPSPSFAPAIEQTDAVATDTTPSPSDDAPSASPAPTQSGDTLATRFTPPEGFTLVAAEEGSFGALLQNLPVQPKDTIPTLYNGSPAPTENVAAVLKLDIPSRDILMTTDLFLKLRAEFLYDKARFAEISYHFSSGFVFDFPTWSLGNRIKLEDDQKTVVWISPEPEASPDTSKPQLGKYLEKLYGYSNPTALKQDVNPISYPEIGDMFLGGGGFMIANLAKNEAGDLCAILIHGGTETQSAVVLAVKDTPWIALPHNNGVFALPSSLEAGATVDAKVGDFVRFRDA